MSGSGPTILIGDANRPRYSWLVELLEQKFEHGKICRADNFDGLLELWAKIPDAMEQPPIIFVADDCPSNPRTVQYNRNQYVYDLKSKYRRLVWIVTSRREPDPTTADREGKVSYIHLADFTHDATAEDLTALCGMVFAELRGIGPTLPVKRPMPIVTLARDDASLTEQVRSLDANRSIEKGKEEIAQLVRRLFENCESVDVARLVQGKSGARVFRISPHIVGPNNNISDEYVLKLIPLGDTSKAEGEVNGYGRATDTLERKFRQHVPKLQERQPGVRQYSEDPDSKHLVVGPQWYGVCYDFVGSDGPQALGKVIDLETALICGREHFIKHVSGTPFDPGRNPPPMPSWTRDPLVAERFGMLKTSLEWLCGHWYRAEGGVKRQSRALWHYDDAVKDPHGEDPPMPPYRLSGSHKGKILTFLDNRDVNLTGANLVQGWKDHLERVQGFIERTLRVGDDALLQERDVVTSPAHGDLNANNILLWLDEGGHPFIIDLLTYQSDGHSLQDLAKLETEIKFSIMDREEDPSRRAGWAYDRTTSQFRFWLDMEARLASQQRAPNQQLRWGSEQSHVKFCMRLTDLIREHARKVQSQTFGHEATLEFEEEYYVPLLYHTLRAITYESLSTLKRLLAVYSASALISFFDKISQRHER